MFAGRLFGTAPFVTVATALCSVFEVGLRVLTRTSLLCFQIASQIPRGLGTGLVFSLWMTYQGVFQMISKGQNSFSWCVLFETHMISCRLLCVHFSPPCVDAAACVHHWSRARPHAEGELTSPVSLVVVSCSIACSVFIPLTIDFVCSR
jgi:hypothetical protein